MAKKQNNNAKPFLKNILFVLQKLLHIMQECIFTIVFNSQTAIPRCIGNKANALQNIEDAINLSVTNGTRDIETWI